MTVAPPPKPGTPAMREMLAVVRGALDLPRAIVVIEGALDRKTMDEVLQKATRGALGRVASLQRVEVVGRLADLFHRDEATATALVKELDKSAHKERHIVASIDEDAIDERLRSYRALDFRRERARLVWALLRDGRAAHQRAATRVLDEAFAALAEKERVVEAAETAVAPGADVAVDGHGDALLKDLRQRLMGYEEAILEQQKQLQREVGHKESVERERAELVARLGAREKALRDEEALRRQDLAEVARLREQVTRLEAALREHDPSRQRALEEEAARLRERVRSLEKAADRLGRIAELEDEVAGLTSRLQQAEVKSASRVADLEQQLGQVLARERATQARLEDARDQLRDARQQLARGSDNPPPAPATGRVGIFVDDANLSASARRDLGSRLDYLALLESLTDHRTRSVALAYVVDAPETPRDKHDAFTHSLRTQGWELREKRAKVRYDGSRKADWDMGMAMEILDHLDEVDVFVIGTGDGDFVPLVKRLRRLGKRVEVAAFRASTDEALIAAADAFIALDGRFRLNR
jgi:uncharacterized LabA/DUF88 family protein